MCRSKKVFPFYIAGIAIITTGFLFYSVPSLFSLIAFIAPGIIFYFGWLTHMGKDSAYSLNAAESAYSLIGLPR